MATICRGYAVASTASLRLSGHLGWLAWLFVHIVWLIGLGSRLLVLIEWAWAYLANQRSGRQLLAPFRREWSGPAPAPNDPQAACAGSPAAGITHRALPRWGNEGGRL